MFFCYFKIFFRNKALSFENKLTENGNNSVYIKFRVFLFPIVIKIKLVFGFIPTFMIASEICPVNAKRIKISVSSLFESKILFFSDSKDKNKIFLNDYYLK